MLMWKKHFKKKFQTTAHYNSKIIMLLIKNFIQYVLWLHMVSWGLSLLAWQTNSPTQNRPHFCSFPLPDIIDVSRQHSLSKGSVFANPKTVIIVTQWWQKYNNSQSVVIHRHQLFPVVLSGLNIEPAEKTGTNFHDLGVQSDSLTYASKRFPLIHLKVLSSEEWIQGVNKACWVLDHNTRLDLRQEPSVWVVGLHPSPNQS